MRNAEARTPRSAIEPPVTRPVDPPVARRPSYQGAAAVLLATLAISQALPWAKRAFGSNVPPLFAKLHPGVGPWLPLALALAVLAWYAVPRLEGVRPTVFLLATMAMAWALAVALAAQGHGLADVSAPFRRPLDYLANVPVVRALGPRAFAERFPALLPTLSLHARTHPPGGVLFLWLVSRWSGGNVTAASLIVVAVGVAGTIPTYLAAREVYDERAARAAAALFAFAPGVLLYSATSMDAVFMTAVAFALAALVRAPRSDAWAFGSGLLTAVALCGTVAALSLGLVGVGVGILAVRDRSSDPAARWRIVRRGLVAMAGVAAGALVLRVAFGIDLPAAFGANLSAHLHDPSRDRPYLYWLVADVPAFLFSAGVAQTALVVAATKARWRAGRPGLETVLLGTLAVMTVSGLFRGEVDHIWLFLMPLVAAPAGGALAAGVGAATSRWGRAMSGPIGGSIGQATITQVLLSTYW
jgi:hypothetical protein